MSVQLPASQSQFKFAIAGLAENLCAVQQFSGRMALSSHYQYQIYCACEQELDVGTILGTRATLTLLDSTANSYIHGLINSCHYLGPSSDGKSFSYLFHLVSNLESLLMRQSTQIFLNKSVIEIVQAILETANWSPSSFLFKTQRNYPRLAFTTQYNETDLSFIERLLSHAGIFYVFVQQPENSQLWFLDNATPLPNYSVQSLPFYTESGTNKMADSIFFFSEKTLLFPQQIKLKNTNYTTPTIDLTAINHNQTEITGSGNYYDYGIPYADTSTGQQLTNNAIQALDTQRQTFVIKTDCRTLQLGQKFNLTNHPQREYNGNYRVISMEMTGNQLAQWHGKNNSPTYQATCLLTKSNRPFKIFPKQPASFTHVLPANIESINNNNAQPYLDDQGSYHARFPFDQSNNPAGEATCPIPSLQHHGGDTTNEQLATGLHFPLRSATQIAVGFTQNDLNLPIILGTIHNPENPSTSNSTNNTQNVIRTFSGNELTLDDLDTAPITQYATKDHKNILLLDATRDQHQIQLISEEGAINTYAKKTLQVKTGDSFLQNSAGNHLVNVKNNHYLLTKNQNISHQANNNLKLKANSNLQMHAQSDIAMQSRKTLQVFANNILSKQINNGDLQLQAGQGDMNIQANQNVIVHTIGTNLTIGQPTGGLIASPSGNLYLASPNINLEAPEINIYGKSVINTQQSSFQYQPPPQLTIQNDTNQNNTNSDKMDENFKLFVSTVYGEAAGCNQIAWQAVGSSIINRLHNPNFAYTKHTGSIREIIIYGHYTAYDTKNSPFLGAWNYLHKRENMPPKLSNVVEILKPIYYDKKITTHADLYYSPIAQNALHDKFPQIYGKVPRDWDFSLLEEVPIAGIEPSNSFKFYKYKEE